MLSPFSFDINYCAFLPKSQEISVFLFVPKFLYEDFGDACRSNIYRTLILFLCDID